MSAKRVYLFLAILLIPLVSFAQKETNIWYFGDSAGLDFNYSPPRILLNSALQAHEGSAIMADREGRLLFYTNGQSVWNRNHQFIENGTGLGGDQSARQAAVIVPHPSSPAQYYILTVDARENAFRNGHRYAVVDLAANGGLGKVTEKGKQLHAPSAESLSVIGSCMEGEEKLYWALAANKDEKGKVFAYKIDKSGIHKTPVVSTFSVKGREISYIKFSPAGNKVVLIDQLSADEIHTADSFTQLIIADFDFASGRIYNPVYQKMNSTFYFNQAEFSSDGKLLYISSGNRLVQIDLSQPSYPIIETLDMNLGITGEFQLAPDGNIYIASATKFLSVIVNPNEAGLQGKFIKDAIELGGRVARLGLPNFVSSYLYQGLIVDAGNDSLLCSGQTLQLGMQPQANTSYQWHPATYLSNSHTANPSFSYHNSGNDIKELEYILTATNEFCSKNDTIRLKVYPGPPDKISGPRSVCPGVEGVVYSVSQTEYYSYQWQVMGGIITAGQGTSSIVVNWGSTNPEAKVNLQASSTTNCQGTILELPVRINVELETETPQGPETVCLNQRKQLQYAVTNTPGSVYTWSIIGGAITSGQGSNQVLVDWQGMGIHRLWLQEQSVTRDTVCFGISDVLEVLVYKDTTEFALDYVSLSLQDDRQAEAQGNQALGALASAGFTLYRRQWESQDWLEVGTASKENISFTDGPLESDSFSYEYVLTSRNPCDEAVSSLPHRTILLQGEIDEATDQVFLAWNPYQGWPEGVALYEVWRRLDDEESFTLIATTNPNSTSFTTSSGADGFRHHFRIRAVAQEGGYASWSNETTHRFNHPLFIPNAFTPNGDEHNQTFAIKKLELYPNNELIIYNRWGKIVYRKSGYTNEWDATGSAAGVYYYSLRIGNQKQQFKGWVMVIRSDRSTY